MTGSKGASKRGVGAPRGPGGPPHISPDDRRYPKRPILGIGAIVIRRGKVLLVERGKEPLKGWWSLPGGVLEAGETLVEGVKREVREETGLDVRPRQIVEVFERIMRDAEGLPEYHYVLIDYLCAVQGGTLAAGDDSSSAEWVARERLASVKLTEGTLPVIEKAFRIHESKQFRTPRI